MFYDIGLSEWVFEIDGIEGEDISRELRKLTGDAEAGIFKVRQAMHKVDAQYDRCFSAVQASI